MSKIFHQAYYIILPLLILGITYKFATFTIALLALVPLLFMSNRHTIGVFLLMYGGPLGGVIRAMYPFIPLYGLFLVFFGVLLLYDLIIDLVKTNFNSLVSMIITLALFAFFYFKGPQDEFAHEKYLSMCIHGMLMVLGYFAFEYSKNIDAEGLLRILFVSSICMICYAMTVLHMIPGTLFDYNWFREQELYVERLNNFEEVIVVGYQHIGLLILFAMAIYMSQIKLKLVDTIFYVICGLQLVLISGCRQAILGVLLIIALRFIVFRRNNIDNVKMIKRLPWITISLVAVLFIILVSLETLNIEVINNTIKEGDEGRSLRWGAAFLLFQDNPVFGGGIGQYHAITKYPWPHNFFLELLCETGIVGTVLFISILIEQFIIKKVGFLYITASNMFYFLIVLGIFVRVMVSSDFRESIELFCAVFAIIAAKKQYLKYRLSKILNIKRFL